MEQRAVILGAAGFIGSHLCDRFLAEGWSVVGIDSLITGTLRNLHHLRREPRFDFLEGDICDPLEVNGPVHAVLDFASPASPVDYLQHPIETLHVGSIGVENALKL
ncbi:MAG: NAD-dependent epimerase/dehydratase family protein, partial [Anaeromyxobacteraceae bacterium]